MLRMSMRRAFLKGGILREIMEVHPAGSSAQCVNACSARRVAQLSCSKKRLPASSNSGGQRTGSGEHRNRTPLAPRVELVQVLVEIEVVEPRREEQLVQIHLSVAHSSDATRWSCGGRVVPFAHGHTDTGSACCGPSAHPGGLGAIVYEHTHALVPASLFGHFGS